MRRRQKWRLQCLLLLVVAIWLLTTLAINSVKLQLAISIRDVLLPINRRDVLLPSSHGHKTDPLRDIISPPPTGNPVGFSDEDCELCDDKMPPKLDSEALSHSLLVRHLGQEKIHLFRHFEGFEPWSKIEHDLSVPGKIPPTVHYLWCKGGFSLGFHHYLGLLSAVRLLQPTKLVFHYNLLPRIDHDMYYTWFLELKQSLPNLVLRRLPKDSPACGSNQLLALALSFLQKDGGIFLGSNVIISRLPHDIHHTPFWFVFTPNINSSTDNSSSHLLNLPDVTRGVVVAYEGFSNAQKQEYLQQILNQSELRCMTPEVFNAHEPDAEENAHCIVVMDKPDIYPVGIMYEDSPFAQLARWLYYGRHRTMYPSTKEGNPIPRISHLIWFNKVDSSPQLMEFYQFLTVLSALYVGGFHHVYIHGNAGFCGQWWDRLGNENVTFVRTDDPEVIYQQAVNNLSHKSDIIRYIILYKYGGAYHDFEAMWTMRVPDWLLDYPCVASSDWVAYGEFPDGINPGVLLAKRHALWLRYNLASHRYYVEENFVWNAVLMSYRTYERHPDKLFFYRSLQVMCDLGICHPTWEPGFRRDINDRRPTMPFNWRTDTLAVHVTRPDPETSLTSPEALRQGSDMFADIGRNILQKSGLMSLIEQS